MCGSTARIAKEGAEHAVAQLQVERDIRSLDGALATAREAILRLNGGISDVRDQIERLERERKNLMDVLERGVLLHPKKRARTDITGGAAPRSISILYALHCRRSTRKGPMYLGRN